MSRHCVCTTRSAVAAAVLSAALLSGCATGLEAQTYRETGRADSGSADVDGIGVRNLHVTPPLNGSRIANPETAVVAGVFTNTGDQADTLTAASSPAAASVTLNDKGAPVTSIAVPANGITSATWSLVMSGLTEELHVGQYVSVTLTFARAGRTTVQIPVRAGDQGLSDREVAQNPYGEGE